MNRHRKRALADERGAVLVSGLLLALALLLMIGAAVDIGHAFIVRRELVSLADDAALAGSQQLDLNALHQGRLQLDPAQAQAAALQTLADQPDIQASADANETSVAVEVTRRFPTVLLGLVGLSDLTVAAHAAAHAQTP
jgi:Flp pilus assembly protein TadG